MLTDPRIQSWTQTCFACPEQYEGRLGTGEYFYFRLRHGMARLVLGHNEVSYGPRDPNFIDENYMVALGDSDGIFEDDEARNGTFKALLDSLDLGAEYTTEDYCAEVD